MTKKYNHYKKSFSFAKRGLQKVWREEANFRLEFIIAILVIALAIFLKLSLDRLAVIILACGAVLALELFNTMIEFVSDLLKPRLNHYVQHIKDIAAAAVLVASLTAIAIGALILVPPLWRLIWQV